MPSTQLTSAYLGWPYLTSAHLIFSPHLSSPLHCSPQFRSAHLPSPQPPLISPPKLTFTQKTSPPQVNKALISWTHLRSIHLTYILNSPLVKPPMTSPCTHLTSPLTPHCWMRPPADRTSWSWRACRGSSHQMGQLGGGSLGPSPQYIYKHRHWYGCNYVIKKRILFWVIFWS